MTSPVPHKSCRRATELLSLAHERELTRGERLWLRVHITLCTPCRRYRRQIAVIRRALRRLVGTPLDTGSGPGRDRLSDSARRRISEAVDRAS